MKLRRVRVENVRSFLEPAELLLEGDISIIIGPNGGGKTNLLDTTTTILRRHLLSSIIPRKSATADNPDRHEFVANDMLHSTSLEPHSQGKGREQVVELELEVTSRDIENMASMKASAHDVAARTERKYVGASIREAAEWDLSLLRVGQRFVYRIVNSGLQGTSDSAEHIYQRYLALYEVDAWLRGELGMASLSTPMLSMPINRASNGVQSSVNLSGYNEFDYKRSVDAASSRLGASTMSLAVGRIAKKYRLLEIKDNGSAKKDFRNDPAIQSLTAVLLDLGYAWDLVCTDPMNNSYDIQLEKQGSKFLAGNASSGEKELLTYLFAIYALNVRDALIVIDEPELHLHPRWQKTLLGLFERLALETGNQFLLATHSAVFVSPSSIEYVSRVYSTEQRSAIVRLNNSSLPEPKHLFAIVNSQNNERMFFADKVVLVEGISDRIFFESVFNRLGVTSGTIRTCEVISVGGKGFFAPYAALLEACKVPYAVIADRDYLKQIGSPEIKGFFTLHENEFKKAVIDDPTSTDGDSLLVQLDHAVSTGDLDRLRSLWEHIKLRRGRLQTDLNDHQQHTIRDYIVAKRLEHIFVLSRGSLESYLPEGYKSKQLDKLIRLISTEYWHELPEFAQEEISVIADRIKVL
ncbi:AAA family ATPase [Comamonas terrae]|uniref:AAA family ATPase n=1 Tax=Comamonas terrae TaxID=673548 RepID=A0ABW5US76_9BURK|nr:AAA family ATPase [Comamonas terrae]